MTAAAGFAAAEGPALAARIRNHLPAAGLSPHESGSSVDTTLLLDKLQAAAELDPSEEEALEAIVYRIDHPVISAAGGEAALAAIRALDAVAARRAMTATIGAVGLLSITGHPTLSRIGTVFRVAPGLVLTTRHVVEMFAEAAANGGHRFRQGLSVAVDFRSDAAAASQAHAVAEVVLVHPVLDLAVLRLSEPVDLPALILDAGGEPEPGQAAAVAGFAAAATELLPFFPEAASPAGVLFSLGRITGHETAVLLGQAYWSVTHDCPTQAGFSGAPLIDLATGRVVGMHIGKPTGGKFFGGYAVPASEIARDAAVRALGVAFTTESPPPDPLAWASDWVEPASVGPDAAAPPTTSPEDLGAVEQALGILHPDYEELVAFVRSRGDAFAQAVDAVLGGAEVPPVQYRRSLVAALARRGLVDAAFRQALGLVEAPPPSTSPPAEADPVALIVHLCETLDLDAIGTQQQVQMLLGSPHWNRIATRDGQPPPFRALLTELAAEPDADARAALISVLRRLRVHREGSAEEEEIGAVLRALGTPVTPSAPAALPEPEEMVPIGYLQAGTEAALSVGRIEATTRPIGSTCWLIAPELVVAPAHLAAMTRQARIGGEFAAVQRSDVDPSDYRVWLEDRDGGEPRAIACRDVSFFDNGLDLMLLRLEQAVEDRRPLQVRKQPLACGGIASIHYPRAGGKMMSLHGGRALSDDGHEMRYHLATAPGVGGAPIFDSQWCVAATHLARVSITGAPDVAGPAHKRGTSVVALVDGVRRASSGDDLLLEIIGAQDALRSVDSTLLGLAAAAGDTPVPVTIGLSGRETALLDIDGLRVIGRLGGLVTALATPSAVRVLAKTQGVVSVAASSAAVAPECFNSVPHIGMLKLRQSWQVAGRVEEEGDKALIAVIDSGIDVTHETFLDADGSTRVEAFWDQNCPLAAKDAPTHTTSESARAFAERYDLKGGALYLPEDIDRIRNGEGPAHYPRWQQMEHGTVVCSIAAGRSTGSEPLDFTGGVATGARIIAIRFDTEGETIGYSNGHLQALDFIDKLATERGLPVVINISNGMNSGAHDGKSAVERLCDTFTNSGGKAGRVIVKSAGNERRAGRHAEIHVPGGRMKLLRFRSAAQLDFNDVTESMELWMDIRHRYKFELVTPSGQAVPLPLADTPTLEERLGNGNAVHADYTSMASESMRSRLKIELRPYSVPRIEKGDWTLRITGLTVEKKEPIRAWIELSRNHARMGLVFLDSVVTGCTITIPGTSPNVITVGASALGGCTMPYDDSSEGPTTDGLEKPEIVAPGVAIRGAAAGQGKAVEVRGHDGTSLAAPHVTGIIALGMSARQRSGKAMLTAAQVRALLVTSCKSYSSWHDPQSGFGELDAEAFFNQSLLL